MPLNQLPIIGPMAAQPFRGQGRDQAQAPPGWGMRGPGRMPTRRFSTPAAQPPVAQPPAAQDPNVNSPWRNILNAQMPGAGLLGGGMPQAPLPPSGGFIQGPAPGGFNAMNNPRRAAREARFGSAPKPPPALPPPNMTSVPGMQVPQAAPPINTASRLQPRPGRNMTGMTAAGRGWGNMTRG